MKGVPSGEALIVTQTLFPKREFLKEKGAINLTPMGRAQFMIRKAVQRRGPLNVVK